MNPLSGLEGRRRDAAPGRDGREQVVRVARPICLAEKSQNLVPVVHEQGLQTLLIRDRRGEPVRSPEASDLGRTLTLLRSGGKGAESQASKQEQDEGRAHRSQGNGVLSKPTALGHGSSP